MSGAGKSLKNTDYVTCMTTKGGRKWKYLKDKNGWKQVGTEGLIHRMTAEQVLDHLLPPLANINPLTAKVVYGPSKGNITRRAV